jgi:hypothetical protein
MNMNIKLTPLVIFVLLLFLLIFAIIFKNEIDYLIPEKWNISEAIYSNNEINWYSTFEGYISSRTYPPLNIPNVYDISRNPVTRPEKSTIYYDASGGIVNFPRNQTVYDQIGNIIAVPPLVGVMTDINGNPITDDFYDWVGNKIQNVERYTGPVYDSCHNLIRWPYINSDNEIAISDEMSPELLEKYIEYMNNTTSSNTYSDISCPAAVNFNQPLDNYISEYYQHFWNQHKQMYSDDYILKSSIPNIQNTQCNASTNNWNMLYGSNNLGTNVQNSLTQTGQNVKAVVDGVGDTIGDIGSGAQKAATAVGGNVKAVVAEVGDTVGDVGGGVQKAATTVGGNVKDVVAEVGDTIGDIGSTAYKAVGTVGGDIKDLAGEAGREVKSALKIDPTQINTAAGTTGTTGTPPTIANTKGLAGNYSGDNATNTGYMKGTNQFSTYSPTDGVANFNNNYNAVPAKSSDFIPVTADFSKFGR